MVLRDGHTVRVRPIVPADAGALVRFHERQSPESVYFRFFSPRPRLSDKEVDHFTHVDHRDRVAFVAVLGDDIIGVARYERYTGTDTAEVAFFVDDDHNGRGLATVMLEYLAAAGPRARAASLRRLHAAQQPQDAGGVRRRGVRGRLPPRGRRHRGRVRHPPHGAAGGGDGPSGAAGRGRVGAAAAGPRERGGRGRRHRSRRAWGPRSSTTWSWRGFTGRLYPVNRDGRDVAGVPAFTDVSQLPDGIDLVVVATPADGGPRCARAVRGPWAMGGAVVLSAGFAEDGPAGADLQREVVAVARLHGMRLLGPNCLGLVNTDPDGPAPRHAGPRLCRPQGAIGMLAESGTLAAAIVDHAERTDLGMSTFVAAGNPADVTSTDLLSYWTDDDGHRRGPAVPGVAGAAVPASSARPGPRRWPKPVAALRTTMSVAGGVPGPGRRTPGRGHVPPDRHQSRRHPGAAVRHRPGAGRPAGAAGPGRGGDRQLRRRGHPGRGRVRRTRAWTWWRSPVPCRSGRAWPTRPTSPSGPTADDYADALAVVAASPLVHAVIAIHASPVLEPADDVAAVILDTAARHPDTTVAATILGTDHATRLVAEDDRCRGAHLPASRSTRPGPSAAWPATTSGGRTADVHGDGAPLGCDTDAAAAVVAGALARRVDGGTVVLDHDGGGAPPPRLRRAGGRPPHGPGRGRRRGRGGGAGMAGGAQGPGPGPAQAERPRWRGGRPGRRGGPPFHLGPHGRRAR